MKRLIVLGVVFLMALGLPAGVEAAQVNVMGDYLWGAYHTEELAGLTATAQGPALRVEVAGQGGAGLRVELAQATLTECGIDDVPFSPAAGGEMTRGTLASLCATSLGGVQVITRAGWTVVEFDLDQAIVTAVPTADRFRKESGPALGVEAKYPLGDRLELTGELGYRPWMAVKSTHGRGHGRGVDFRAALEGRLTPHLLAEAGYTSAQHTWTRDSDSSEHEQCVYGFFLGARAQF